MLYWTGKLILFHLVMNVIALFEVIQKLQAINAHVAFSKSRGKINRDRYAEG